MATTLDEERVLDAAGAAALAAQRCRLTIELVRDPAGADAAATLLRQIWKTPYGAPVAPEMLLALVHTGNYAALARCDGEPVAASAAFRTGDAVPHLHSHITGVADGHRGRSVGYAMKLFQRAWALEHGCSEISWTFDPMQSRNAYFNVMKLGATFDSYIPDFYGDMGDEINKGSLGDRALVRWDLTSVLSSQRPAPPAAGPPVTRMVEAGMDGIPVVVAAPGAEAVSIAVPEDVGRLRRTDPDGALRWHRAVREAFVSALADGYAVIAFDPDHHYVLRKATHASAPS